MAEYALACDCPAAAGLSASTGGDLQSLWSLQHILPMDGGGLKRDFCRVDRHCHTSTRSYSLWYGRGNFVSLDLGLLAVRSCRFHSTLGECTFGTLVVYLHTCLARHCGFTACFAVAGVRFARRRCWPDQYNAVSRLSFSLALALDQQSQSRSIE